MQDPVGAEPVPLATDATGTVRVAGSRVTLDTVVAAFNSGATPEQIAQDYPLRLDDIYAVITYYLRHTDEVRKYLEKRKEQAVAARHEASRRYDQSGLRDQLLSRLHNSAG
jgi:uncharacterized protein (DUF433 family)